MPERCQLACDGPQGYAVGPAYRTAKACLSPVRRHYGAKALLLANGSILLRCLLERIYRRPLISPDPGGASPETDRRKLAANLPPNLP